MINVNDLYKAEASSFINLATGYNAVAGFRIPEYQREYNWSKDNINRLYFDALNGLVRLSDKTNAIPALTFLGTVILVRETSKEPEFSGESLAVVDGQQRLTTLSLFSCALVEALRRVRAAADLSALEKHKGDLDWLNGEIEHRLNALCACAVGLQPVTFGRNYPFPRIVRPVDTRGNSEQSAEYCSPIGKFLHSFSKYYDGVSDEFTIEPPNEDSAIDDRLHSNYKTIRTLISKLNEPAWYEDTECEMFDVGQLTTRHCRGLMERLPDHIREENERQKSLSRLANLQSLHGLVRTLAFASYFCNYMVLTRVTTDDEAAAFDIFDSLNTTGEPLTALETLRPRAIHFEDAQVGSRIGYAGSDSERAFTIIAENIDERISNADKRQAETKEMVVTFALYVAGEKRSKDLADQRNFLRLKFDQATSGGESNARRFLEMIADLTTFRRYYWDKTNIKNELYEFHGDGTLDDVRLLVSFVHEMGTSLVLPILARYWNPTIRATGDSSFLSALKAVAAFIVLRRAATGGTAGIDSDLRKVMSGVLVGESKFSLMAGVEQSREALSLDELKSVLTHLLQDKLGATLDRDRWINVVSTMPLYSRSKPLVRFMLLAAADQSQPSKSSPGIWERQGVRTAVNDREFLNYRTWTAEEYETVEHVAPETRRDGWQADLYGDNDAIHALGNLVLLPREENSSIGNESWGKKRLFYLALTEQTDKGQKERFNEASEAGIAFGSKTAVLLENAKRLPLLDSLRDVEEWDLNIVNRRSKNVAELCWDALSKWVFPNEKERSAGNNDSS